MMNLSREDDENRRFLFIIRRWELRIDYILFVVVVFYSKVDASSWKMFIQSKV